MPKSSLLWVTALSLAATACDAPNAEQDAPPQGGGSDVAQAREAIEGVDREWEQAANRGDAAGLAALYTDDAYFLAPNMELVQGRENIRQTLQAFIDAGMSSVDFTSVDVGVSGELAYEVGRYSLEIGPEGQRVTDTGKYVIVARRQPDGSWKLVADMFNSSQPAPGAQ